MNPEFFEPPAERRMTMRRLPLLLLLIALTLTTSALAEDEKEGPWSSGDFSALAFRSIGPALTAGRIGDFAIDPRDPNHYYVGVCSGNLWETRNAGVTFTPIFDDQGSFAIGCVTLAPSQPDIVWVGTGENNSQRSVPYGDGIYKSLDGGRSWENMGLERSLHIGKIIVHPTDPDVVFVAAMGPLWGPGGDRGVFKTTDGGQNWTLVLEIDENTGVVDMQMDPRDPDVLYASSYQRRRHVWTLINGGPGSGIHKTSDGGATWTELTKGLPSVDMGRIGLAISPPAPDTIYAIIEAADGKGGFFRSTDAGMNWTRMSDYVARSPQYYNELVADPLNPDRVYSMDTFMQVTEDGGKTFSRVGITAKHVDEHALWIDPHDTDHLLTGNDGGVYESFDRGANWRFMANLPITQFYRVAVDNDVPFYNVYGGTQDNNTQGGPSRTHFAHGIANRDWYLLLGGDGFEPAVDPTNPDIIYCQWQYGNLNRYERNSGEKINIQPQPEAGEILKWNWNSPLIISPHNPKRLYYACQKIFRSDDMGDSWTKISEDLTTGTDRNKLEVMGRVWGVDAVAKNRSTSFYGSLVSLNESPLREGLLMAGTDDGLIQVSRDGGNTWTEHGSFSGVPDGCYVSDVEPSRFDEQVIYASFDNHKRDDFTPYLLRSDNYGKSWKAIAGNLPENGPVHSIALDHVDPELIFVGTEFGVFFTRDGGKHWTRLKAGIPTIACRDLEIQRRESDLVVATFGRGFYILDDYTPLRNLEPATFEQDAVIFPVKDAWIYNPANQIGYGERGSQGASFYSAPNPPFGAVITYHLKEGLESLKDMRQQKEKELVEDEKPVYYPSWEELRAEDREQDPLLILTVRDAAGQVVKRFAGPGGAGLHRVAWDLRYPYSGPIHLSPGGKSAPWESDRAGALVVPGRYSVTLAQRVRGAETVLAGPVEFDAKPLGLNTTANTDYEGFVAFREEADELYRAVQGASHTYRDADNRLKHIRKAIKDTPELDTTLLDEVDVLAMRLADLGVKLHGDRTISSRSEPTTPSISSRAGGIFYGVQNNTSGPTRTMRDHLVLTGELFAPVLADLTALVTVDLKDLEDRLEAAGAPYTPGRVPVWRAGD
jgi:photosystem II stability/assembly factor-like uncharacterized protein